MIHNSYSSYNTDNNDIEGLVYRIPCWDAEQWKDYIYSNLKDFERIKNKSDEKTELYPLFMNEIFQRVLRGDKVERLFDTHETFKERLQEWKEQQEEWRTDLDNSGLNETDYKRIFGDEPVKPEKREIKKESVWANNLHQSLEALPEWLTLLSEVGNETNHLKKWILAGVAAFTFGEQCLEMLPKPEKPLVNPEKLREQVRELKKELEQAKQGGNTIKVNDLENKLDNLVKRGKNEIDSYNQFTDKIKPLSELIVKAATEKAIAEVEAMQAVLALQDCNGWGDEERGLSEQSEGSEEKLANAKKLLKLKDFRKIINLAGRLLLLAETKRKSKIPIASAITGVKTGDNLFNLLPIEYGYYAHQKTRTVFLKNYSEKSLLEFDRHDNTNAQKGPVVMLLDTSSSMMGDKEIWSKAVAIAYLQLCNKDKRDFYCVTFNASPVSTFEFKKGKYNINTLSRFINNFSGGGTNWMKPLSLGVEIIESSPVYKKADIVLITDEQCGVQDNWLKEFNAKKEALKFTVFSVIIGSNNTEPLKPFSDKAISIQSVQNNKDSDIILDIF